MATSFLLVAGLTRRLVVEGGSMAPTLVPGDRLLAVRHLPPRAGRIVAARDPRRPARLLVKRVVEVRPDQAFVLAGDAPGQSTDSRQFGPVKRAEIVGTVVYRYSPIARRGALLSNALGTRW